MTFGYCFYSTLCYSLAVRGEDGVARQIAAAPED
jgi:hypothetical protein